MKNIKNLFTAGLVASLFIGLFSVALAAVAVPGQAAAATAHLSVSSVGGNQVHIGVNADPNASVLLYYYPSGSGNAVYAGTIGTTNYAGSFSTTVSSGQYNIQSGSIVYVVVNGFQSMSATWPSSGGSTGGQIYFGQSSLSVNSNQTASTQIYGGSGSYYISSNSNSNVATANIVGNAISVTGVSQGSMTFSVCSQASSGGCANLFVTVNSTWWGGSSSVTLSQSSVTLQQGQVQSVTIYGGSGSYYISNSPGANIASASIVNNNTVQVTATNPGTVSFSICSTSLSYACTSLLVTVTSYYGYGSTYYGSNYYDHNYYYPYQSQYVQPTYTYVQPTTYAPTVGQPVSGVFLNQIPATGISFGLKMTLFTFALALWSLFAAYVLHKNYGAKESSAALRGSAGSNAASAGMSANIAERFKEMQRQRKGL